MAKAFKKGDRVTVITNWDGGKGTVAVRHATVHSCGSKVLRLTCDITGDEFGSELVPAVAAPGEWGVRPFIEGAALEAEGLAVAKGLIEKERAHLNDCIARNRADARDFCPRYIKYMEGEIAAIHEPRVAMWADVSLTALRYVEA
jgi:hypothetical protein